MRCRIFAFVLGFFILISCSAVLAATPTQFIDCESAYTLEKNQYQLELRFYQDGGVLMGATGGLTDELTIGASYGGSGIVGTGVMEGNPEPAFHIKYRLQNDASFPFELAVGYNGQGYGPYYRKGATVQIDQEPYVCTRNFYQVNSKGFYIVASRSFPSSRITVTGGLNHCLEDDPGKPGIAAFIGAAYHMSPQVGLTLEYNNLLHQEINPEDIFVDPTGLTEPIRKAGGELNLGLTFVHSPGFSLRISLKDLTNVYSASGNRTFQIFYVGEF